MEFKNIVQKQKTVDNIILNAVQNVVSKRGDKGIDATLTQVQKTIYTNISKEDRKILPKSPSSLRIVLNRIINRLKVRGIRLNFTRTNSKRICTINNCRK